MKLYNVHVVSILPDCIVHVHCCSKVRSSERPEHENNLSGICEFKCKIVLIFSTYKKIVFLFLFNLDEE